MWFLQHRRKIMPVDRLADLLQQTGRVMIGRLVLPVTRKMPMFVFRDAGLHMDLRPLQRSYDVMEIQPFFQYIYSEGMGNPLVG